ncbi:MAG: VOC family protein [Desulfatibacillum sp.]|nr:VOC family protein [Desulfatibacillum sp.]
MVYLEDLLLHDDFARAVDALGHPFVQEMKLGPVHQLGLIVPDAEAASRRLEQKGVKPFFLASGPVDMWTENGKDRNFSGKLGSSLYQGKELELLEPGEGSDFYRRALDPKGRIVVHHLAFLVPDVDEAAERLTASGCPLWVRGRIKKGPYKIEFAYMDALGQCGFVLEFMSHRLLGRPVKPPAGLYAFLGKVQKKTGKRSLDIT